MRIDSVVMDALGRANSSRSKTAPRQGNEHTRSCRAGSLSTARTVLPFDCERHWRSVGGECQCRKRRRWERIVDQPTRTKALVGNWCSANELGLFVRLCHGALKIGPDPKVPARKLVASRTHPNGIVLRPESPRFPGNRRGLQENVIADRQTIRPPVRARDNRFHTPRF